MKQYLNYMLILFVGIIMFCSAANAEYKLPLYGRTIVIDPGHGGLDPGTLHGDIYEKNLNLNISLMLKQVVEKYGGFVILTRDGDYDLSSPTAMFRKKSDFDNRIKLINNSTADLYLSIHMNYLTDSRYYGPQVFYKMQDKLLANSVQKTLNKNVKSDRKIKPMPVDTYMYRQLNVSGLLIECGFISNAKDRKNLLSPKYQQKIAEAITDGIINFYKISKEN